MLNVAIIEDDVEATRRLRAALERFALNASEPVTVTEFPEATRFLDGYKPTFDVVFMDIEMPTMDGMTAAARLRELDTQVILIFVTNMVQYASKGYEVDAMDYILKPFAYADFERKFERAVRACRRGSTSLIVADQSGTRRVLLREIEYIEVRGHSLLLHTESGIVRGSGTLQATEAKLSGEGFLRCSKAYLVNQMHVRAVRGSMLEMSSGDQLSIGRSFRRSFMSGLAALIGDSHVL